MEIRHQFGCWEFLSTPSARRATPPAHWAGGLLLYISIHALRKEGDPLRGFFSRRGL